MTDDWRERIERAVDGLAQRVSRLEERRAVPRPPEGDLWALDGLQERVGDDGGVVYAGAVRLATGDRYVWQEAYPTAHVRQLDWELAAGGLAALGHPVRLALLRAILDGTRTVRELCELPGMGTSGQVYHHLREMQAAGWVVSERRGSYQIPPSRIIPLLVVVTAAGGGGGPGVATPDAAHDNGQEAEG